MTRPLPIISRRSILHRAAMAAGGVALSSLARSEAPEGFRPLFDGKTLTGWNQKPRINVPGPNAKPLSDTPFNRANDASTGKWEARDGMILGGQSEQRMEHPLQKVDWGFGGWLMTDELFGDFELLIDAHPDWPCDTGVYVRTTELGQGFQVLLDHRGDDAKGVGGGVGFLYCKGIGNMRVDPNNFRWELAADGLPMDVKLIPGTDGVTKVDHACTSDDFRYVDKLLASPRFGEKWVRHWLDLARYGDSAGYQHDLEMPLWLYRDWVIRAFNSDMPFDRFTFEQLAGDLLPNATTEQRIATGFSRCATATLGADNDAEELRTQLVWDRVNTVGTTFLGSSLECSQCHNHKFDPFKARARHAQHLSPPAARRTVFHLHHLHHLRRARPLRLHRQTPALEHAAASAHAHQSPVSWTS